MDRNYYCSNKFKFIKVDLDAGQTFTCHAAKPIDIDYQWLENNPGQIFNTDENINDRKMMLNNERCPNCEQNCWKAEDIGGPSPRILQKGIEKTHTDLVLQPEAIDITINSDCNMTCSYCCKIYSTAWKKDIAKNGTYDIPDYDNSRYSLTDKDRVLLKIKRSELKKSKRYKIVFDQIYQSIGNLKKICITGGETFLDNSLIDFFENLHVSKNTEVQLFTSLGVTESRFKKTIDCLLKFQDKNLGFLLTVSGENIGEYFEFNRYGIKWNDFDKKIEFLKKHNVNFKFHATLSNLTVFGFKDFCDYYKEMIDDTGAYYVYQPNFSSCHIIDPESKDMLLKDFEKVPTRFRDHLTNAIKQQPTEQERIQTRSFIKQFVKRRHGLSLSIYPKSFTNWLDL